MDVARLMSGILGVGSDKDVFGSPGGGPRKAGNFFQEMQDLQNNAGRWGPQAGLEEEEEEEVPTGPDIYQGQAGLQDLVTPVNDVWGMRNL